MEYFGRALATEIVLAALKIFLCHRDSCYFIPHNYYNQHVIYEFLLT